MKNKQPNLARFTDIAILVAIAGLLFSYFKPHYLFSKTIATGGDVGSHYYTAFYLKEFLLPKLKIIGWTQGNYAGFPLFIFYFPLPFLMMALMSYLIPLQIAFKLVTILGIFLLPLCAYFSLRQMKYKFPIPIFGALCTLPFLFMEANSVWGGNIFSTLAGEFAFSLGFALSILFIGSLYQGILSERRVLTNGILLALIGFSHGYTLLFSGLASLFFLITTQVFFKKLKYLIKIHGLAFLLMGAWIVPLLLNLPSATGFNVIWYIYSIFEVFPVILLPLVGIVLLGRLLSSAHAFWKDKNLFKFSKPSWLGFLKNLDLRICYLWFAALASGFVYLIAFRIHVVDVRFLPFLQILVCILAAIELGRAVQRVKGLVWLSPILLAIAIFSWVVYQTHQTKNIRAWIDWNYTGFENKPGWPMFEKINQALLGGPADPRVVYEHSPEHNKIGTVRAFEALPLFSGRSTLEGLYIQSSLSTPFVFYIQSEISKEISCPLPDYDCSKFDLENAIRHFKMFNVQDYIVVSDEVRAEVAKHKEFKLKHRFELYDLYELTTNENRYVTPLSFEPVLFQTDQWKVLSYRWFKDPSVNDVHLVFVEKPNKEDHARFQVVRSGNNLSNLPRIPIDSSCRVTEEIKDEEINIRTNCIHKPLLIKISYHPNWKVTGANRIYLASPSFMLVYPNQENVKLVFSKNKINFLGITLTTIGILLLMIHLPWQKNSRSRYEFDQMILTISKWIKKFLTNNALYAEISNTFNAHRTKILVSAWGTVGFLLFSFAVISNQKDPVVLYNRAVQYRAEKKFKEARLLCEQIIQKYPDTRSGIDAYFGHAITYFLEKNYPKAIEGFEQLIKNYPTSLWVPESYYHLGLSHASMGEKEKATLIFQAVVQNYPTSRFAKEAKTQLARLMP